MGAQFDIRELGNFIKKSNPTNFAFSTAHQSITVRVWTLSGCMLPG